MGRVGELVRSSLILGGIGLVVGCGGGDDSRGTAGLPTGIASLGDGGGGGGTAADDPDAEGDGGSEGDDGGDGAMDADGDGGMKWDVAMPDAPGYDCVDGVGEDCTGCTAVDLLFVVDNSQSMEDEQIALGQAFPTFADTILDALPEHVNLHVGVTSTEMGYSPQGGYDVTNPCLGTGVNGAPAENWYYGYTPDVMSSGHNGAQGRLYTALGKAYFEIDTDAGPTEVQALKDWFADASHIGQGGSNVEMPTAAAAWAMDTTANPLNIGFVRDEGAVLVLFVVQDEPDQSPIDESATFLNKIVAAKQACGGWDCIVGGGFVNEYCAPQTAIGDVFDSMTTPPITATLPMNGVTPQTFEPVLADTLAQVIVDKCGEIEPPG